MTVATKNIVASIHNEIHSVMRKDEILPLAIMWMEWVQGSCEVK